MGGFLRGKKGFSLVAVIVTSVIAFIVMLGIMSLLNSVQKRQKHIEYGTNFEIMIQGLQSLFASRQFCSSSFRTTSGGEVVYDNTAASIDIPEIRLGTNPIAAINQSIGTGIKITKLQIVPSGTAPDTITISGIAYNVFLVTLTVEATKGQKTIGSDVLRQTFLLKIYVKSDTGEIKFCGNSASTASSGQAGAVIARHSSTTSPPACPNGWEELWQGFSFMGSTTGVVSAGDMGAPGSCVGSFKTIPFIECGTNPDQCDYITGSDFSLWLTTIQSTTSLPLVAGVAANLPNVSRCAVCSKNVNVVVRHSFTTSPPGCPTGWTETWNGYSFGGSTANNAVNNLDLGKVGTCLEHFQPINFIECRNGGCQYDTYGDYTIWMTTLDSVDEPATTGVANILPKVSRCSVCEK